MKLVLFVVAGVVSLVAIALVVVLRDAESTPAAFASLPVPQNLVVTPVGTTPESDRCDLVVDPMTSAIRAGELQPGDVVCLPAGTRGALHVHDARGTELDPIVIINDGGAVVIEGTPDDYAGIDIRRSEHVVVTGTGTSRACGSSVEPDQQSCGIVVRGAGRGVAGTDRTAFLTIDHLEIEETSKSGVFIRTAAKNGTTRDEWTQHGTAITDNYVHDTGTEGLYLGSSSYADGADPVLIGVEAARNLIVDTGWDGLQVGSAERDCSIRDNRVIRSGLANRDNQRSGIINNRGSVCDIESNVIVTSAGQGIYVQGNGGNVVANNLVIHAGWMTPDDGDGISINRGSNTDRSILVYHNTVVEPARSGIRFRNDVGSGNEIRNNLVAGSGGEGFDTGTLASVGSSHNLDFDDVASAGFADPSKADFRLAAESPAIDVGFDLGAIVSHDLIGGERPVNAAFDPGAFEYAPAGGAS